MDVGEKGVVAFIEGSAKEVDEAEDLGIYIGAEVNVYSNTGGVVKARVGRRIIEVSPQISTRVLVKIVDDVVYRTGY